MKTAVVNGKVVTKDGVREDVSILIQNGKIKLENCEAASGFVFENGKIVEKKSKPAKVKADKVIDAKGAYVLPGFFDTHIHGGGFFLNSTGVYDPKKNKFDRSDKAMERGYRLFLGSHAAHGTTSLMYSIASSSDGVLEEFMRKAGKLTGAKLPKCAKVQGIDMEGTYIKDKAFGGAQNPDFFKLPDPKYFDKLNKLSGGNIKKVLVAPEWGDPAIKFIKHLVKNGVAAGVGHAGADYDEMMRAYDAGVTYAVHFGNGPMSQNFKGGGVLDAMFALKDKITIEIIGDLCHVHPRWVAAFIKAFNFNIAGITDAMFFSATGSKIKSFDYEHFSVEIKNGAAWVKGKKNTLCGSCATADIVFNNFLNILTSNTEGYLTGRIYDKPVTLDKAVSTVSSFMSVNPARLYGMDAEIGSIADGKRADMMIMDITQKKGGYASAVKKVFIDGEEL